MCSEFPRHVEMSKSAWISVYLKKVVRNVDAFNHHFEFVRSINHHIERSIVESSLLSHVLSLDYAKKVGILPPKTTSGCILHILISSWWHPWLHLTCQQNWTEKQELSFGYKNKEQLFLLSSEVSNAARGYKKEFS